MNLGLCHGNSLSLISTNDRGLVGNDLFEYRVVVSVRFRLSVPQVEMYSIWS